MFDSLFQLKGRVALVTGSSQGLGYAMAKGLSLAGAKVIINGRNEGKLENTVNKMKKSGYDVYGHAFDITKEQEIEEKISLIEENIGSIDILVNNAGIQKRSSLIEIDKSLWREVIETNLTGAFLITKRVIKGMITKKSGKIINVCSLLSELGRETTAPYAAAKGGLKMLTKSMAVEWGKYNIQINGIGPGYFATDMNLSLVNNEQFDKWVRYRTPANRWGKPEELMGTVIFLSSAASNFINGQIIYVDGGLLASI